MVSESIACTLGDGTRIFPWPDDDGKFGLTTNGLPAEIESWLLRHKWANVIYRRGKRLTVVCPAKFLPIVAETFGARWRGESA